MNSSTAAREVVMPFGAACGFFGDAFLVATWPCCYTLVRIRNCQSHEASFSAEATFNPFIQESHVRQVVVHLHLIS